MINPMRCSSVLFIAMVPLMEAKSIRLQAHDAFASSDLGAARAVFDNSGDAEVDGGEPTMASGPSSDPMLARILSIVSQVRKDKQTLTRTHLQKSPSLVECLSSTYQPNLQHPCCLVRDLSSSCSSNYSTNSVDPSS
jgi:hypothetical protein